MVLHSITARFCLKPLFRHVDFHFPTYKRDLAILTEWWQQRIAWWELLNAACQMIYIRKQQHRYKAYSAGQTVPSTAKIRAEANNTKCVGKKRFNGSVTHGLWKEHVLRFSPSHFGQGKIIYANHLPWNIAVIVVFSKSRDKFWKWKWYGEIIRSKGRSCCNRV